MSDPTAPTPDAEPVTPDEAPDPVADPGSGDPAASQADEAQTPAGESTSDDVSGDPAAAESVTDLVPPADDSAPADGEAAEEAKVEQEPDHEAGKRDVMDGVREAAEAADAEPVEGASDPEPGATEPAGDPAEVHGIPESESTQPHDAGYAEPAESGSSVDVEPGVDGSGV